MGGRVCDGGVAKGGSGVAALMQLDVVSGKIERVDRGAVHDVVGRSLAEMGSRFVLLWILLSATPGRIPRLEVRRLSCSAGSRIRMDDRFVRLRSRVQVFWQRGIDFL